MFITNEKQKNLGERLKAVIKDSRELKFLTAFFYFSAIPELYSALKERYEKGDMQEGFIKVLVGLNVDLATYRIYEHTFSIPSLHFYLPQDGVGRLPSLFYQAFWQCHKL